MTENNTRRLPVTIPTESIEIWQPKKVGILAVNGKENLFCSGKVNVATSLCAATHRLVEGLCCEPHSGLINSSMEDREE